MSRTRCSFQRWPSEVWSFPVSVLDGAGGESRPADAAELVLSDVQLVVPLSEWPELTATVTPEQAVTLTPWRSVIYCVHDDMVVAACLVSSLVEKGDQVEVTGVGFAGVMKGMPWTAAPRKLYVYNTGQAFKDIWLHVQGSPGGNLGMVLTDFSTAATVGRGSAGGTVDEPFVLSPVETHDLSESIDLLVQDGIEFRESHDLIGSHVLVVGTESDPIGADLTLDCRLEVGLNVTSALQVDLSAEDSPTGVLVTGGTDNPVWGVAYAPDAVGVRRVAAVTDVNATSNTDAAARAQTRLAKFRRAAKQYTVTVVDTPLARLHGFAPGDTVAVHGTRWGGVDYVATGRISSVTHKPGDGTADFDIVPTGGV